MLDEFFNIRIGDFGSALKVENKYGLTRKKRGTQNYMAPEVRDLNTSDPKSYFNAYKADVYSLGVCLFILLFKQFPVLKDSKSDENPFTVPDSKWYS